MVTAIPPDKTGVTRNPKLFVDSTTGIPPDANGNAITANLIFQLGPAAANLRPPRAGYSSARSSVVAQKGSRRASSRKNAAAGICGVAPQISWPLADYNRSPRLRGMGGFNMAPSTR
jgi:hypothetical protein